MTTSRRSPSRWARWLSARSLLCHAALVIFVPGFLLAAWWQVHRAMQGNLLSYAYSVEWPAFAGVAVWAWWKIVHLPPAGDDAWKPVPTRPTWLRWDPAEESPELQAYNRYLLEIHVTGKRRGRWSPPSIDKGPAEAPDEVTG